MGSTASILKTARVTWVDLANPSKNYVDAKRLGLKSAQAFTLLSGFGRPFPLGATITSATLKVYAKAAWGVNPTLTAKRNGDAYSVSKVNWSNKPSSTGASATAAGTNTGDGYLYAFDVTVAVQAVSDGGPWYGFQITTSDTTLRYLYGSEDDLYTPTLDVTWSEAPDAPTSLSPGGNRQVSIAKPVVRCDYTDVAANTTLQSIQVQINATDVWTSPSFDSGTVATTTPELDLSATAYAGLSAGSSTYWRVRIQDSAGLWSDWSDSEQFGRTNDGTPTITNPAVSPNNFVSEPTPPIMWSWSGTTQRAYQLLIATTADPNHILWDTGKITSTTTSVTVDKNIINDDAGLSYRLTVRIWDTISREATPGDPPYVDATRDFTFNKDVTVNAPATLTATQAASTPWVDLSWTRSTAPDSWTVIRDGNVLESGLLPVDTFVSGTTYTWRDWTARPQVSHTYLVRAVVGGKASSGGPTAALTTSINGIWLADRGKNLWVCIREGGDGSWTMPDTGETYLPLNAAKPVRLVQALQGYVGSITGTITDSYGFTAQQWRTNLWKLKENPERTYTMLLQDLAIDVVLGNVATSPRPNNPNIRDVSFDFWQVGKLEFDAVLS